MARNANFLKAVKEQYEDYPYPPRDPQDEKKRLLSPYTEIPDRLNHYCFGGKKHFDKNFRMLIAGGGTGDSSVYAAEVFGEYNVEIIHLDLSKTSIEVAKERLKIRGLENKVKFLQASLLDLPKMGLGKFDYINCSGVLHHLSIPEEGLRALESVLAPDGAMALMVYAKYGRLGVYPMQSALRTILQDIENRDQKIRYTKNLISNLPGASWFNFSRRWFGEDLHTDNGIYDLLLHPQDRAYSIPELYEYIKSAGLESLSLQHYLTGGEYLYDPFRFVLDEGLQIEIKKLPLAKRQEIGELLASNIIMHTFYTARHELVEPDYSNEDFVPITNQMFSKDMPDLLKAVLTAQSDSITMMNPLKDPIFIDILPSTAALLVAIDSKRTIKEIIDEVSKHMSIPRLEVSQHFNRLFVDLRPHDIIFLRHKSVEPYLTFEDIQKNMLQRTAKK